MYENYLGLSLERQVKGALVFKMRNVDPNEPKRLFSFAVRINDDTEQYSGVCGHFFPPVHMQALDSEEPKWHFLFAVHDNDEIEQCPCVRFSSLCRRTRSIRTSQSRCLPEVFLAART